MSVTPIINSERYRNSLTTPVIIEVNGQPNGYEITVPEINKTIYKTSLSTDPIIIEMSGQGPQGMRGPQGNDGNGIDRIEKTSTSGITDTYTIYFTNGTQFQYQLTNGVVYYYEGPYEVDSSIESQSLSTANLVMKKDVNINGISYQEISNLSGGYTATIGN